MEIGFQKGAYTLILATGLAMLTGCDAGGSTIPYTPAPEASTNAPPDPVPTPAPTPAPTPIGTGQATISWSAPLTRLNGNALSLGELAGYKIYYGTSLGNYPYVVNIQDRTVTQYTLQGPPNTVYYVVVTSIDTAGKASANSNVVVKAL